MSRRATAPLLSVLIPAYRYPDGIARILGGLGAYDPDLVEILISDDSPDQKVETVVQRAGLAGVGYQRNSPPLGAPANWNALLEKASGEFCLMLHHDEFPLSDDFLKEILRQLAELRTCDVFLLDCVLVDPCAGRNRRHLPFGLRMAAVRHAPSYLLRRNVVGPVSVIIVRRILYPMFDPKLKWLVDVDVYLRLFAGLPKIAACPHILVGSILGRKDSITAQLGTGRTKVAAEERRYLWTKHRGLAFWYDSSPGHHLLRAGEWACWVFFRAVTRALCVLFPPGLGKRPLRQYSAAE